MEKIKIIKKEDKKYPKKLLAIPNPPKQLYLLGDETLLNQMSLAIIGSRNCTMYGYQQAVKFAKEIASNHICIVSGMAVGIDTASHIGAKSQIGKTIAVLGGGFEHIFPKENEELFHEIIEEGGCIVSEYAPNVACNRRYFPKRNRIISGLSEGVLVVEARYRSGTSITANYAKKQGKTIYCIPSNVDSTTGYGTGILVQNGAKLVLTPQDILKDFNIFLPETLPIQEEKKHVTVEKAYRPIYNMLTSIPMNINEICKNSHMTIEKVNVALTMLELQGVIKQVGVNEFIKI